MVLTWIPAQLWKYEQGTGCSGELESYVNQFSQWGLALSVVLLPAWMIICTTIWVSLGNGKARTIAFEERQSAVKAVMYTLLNVLQWVSLDFFHSTSSRGTVPYVLEVSGG